MSNLRSMLVPALVVGSLWSLPAGPGGHARTSERPVYTRGTGWQGLPAGVTADMVRQGRRLFSGAGLCSSCHGHDGRGLPNLASNLTDREWSHSDGSYKGIVSTIETGVPAERSSTGIPMPPRAGANLTDEQVRAVAAYVWTLSHGGG